MAEPVEDDSEVN